MPRSDRVAATVHVIDDDASVLRALRRLLRAAGFIVETFTGTDEFVAATRSSPPHCLVLDIHLGIVTSSLGGHGSDACAVMVIRPCS